MDALTKDGRAKAGIWLLVAVVAAGSPGGFAQTAVDSPSDLTWYKSRSGDSITPGAGTVLFTEGQTSGSTFLANFPAASVAVGQILSVNVGFTTGATVDGANSNSFRFGVFNSGNSQVAANFNSNSNPAFTNDYGYGFGLNFNGSNVDLRARNGADPLPNTLLSSYSDTSGWTTSFSAIPPTGTIGPFLPNTAYTLGIELTKTADGYTGVFSLNGGNAVNYGRSFADTTSSSRSLSSFDEFAFYINGGSNTISSLTMTSLEISTVPEPVLAPVLAVAAAAAGLWGFRRRSSGG